MFIQSTIFLDILWQEQNTYYTQFLFYRVIFLHQCNMYFYANSDIELEMFYLNSTQNFGILPVLVFQIEVYYKVDRLLTGLTAQQKGTWYFGTCCKTGRKSIPRLPPGPQGIKNWYHSKFQLILFTYSLQIPKLCSDKSESGGI